MISHRSPPSWGQWGISAPPTVVLKSGKLSIWRSCEYTSTLWNKVFCCIIFLKTDTAQYIYNRGASRICDLWLYNHFKVYKGLSLSLWIALFPVIMKAVYKCIPFNSIQIMLRWIVTFCHSSMLQKVCNIKKNRKYNL